ncbi:MAG: hypothetical protein LUI87_15575 [Lachnospiraceae bacterium]|nr:hypothetical protein [Lachnospiraceae bacterium]
MGLVLTENQIRMIVILLSTKVAPWLWGIIKTWMDGRKKQPEVPRESRSEMSKTDKEKVNETREIIKKHFTEDPAEAIGNMSNIDRVQATSDFVKDLAKAYGLDIDIDVALMDSGMWGFYNFGSKKAVFNVSYLMVDKDNEKFKYIVKEFLDTIVHELRHAVQHRAVEEPGFWDVSDERRAEWAYNMQHYIKAETDIKAYAKQPIENDAASFAAMALEGMV